MAITTLDEKTALIIIDLQKGIVALPTCHSADDVIARSAELARHFRARKLPVAIVNVAGAAPGRNEMPHSGKALPANWAELVPGLGAEEGDLHITKKTWGAFNNTALHEQLQQLGVTQVVLVGIATAIGVESTARQAYELGYNVTLATDAMTDLSIDTHNNSCTRIFPKLGETGSYRDVIALLDDNARQ